MRKILAFITLAFISLGLTMGNTQKIGLKTSNAKQQLTVLSQSQTEITLRNTISTIIVKDRDTRGGAFLEVHSEGYYKNTELGAPQLPMINKLVEIPYGAEVKVVVLDYDEELIDLNQYGFNQKLLPVQTSVSKSQDIEDVPFEINKAIYDGHALYGKDIASVEYVGVSRGVQIGRLRISPFSYHPQTNQLYIKNNLTIKLKFENADVALTGRKKQKYYSPAFSSVFSNMLRLEPTPTRDQIVNYGPVKYIIVADRMFESALEPFVAWKTLKGFNVIEAYTDDIGNTTSDIKAYLQEQYENPSDGIAPSYALLVGDIAQIPAWGSSNTGSGDSDHITDLYYFDYTNDNIPELYYGRFSATSVAELTPQISKTIEYERYEMADPSFLNEVVLVAGVDGSWAPSHGNGQIHYGVNNYFNAEHGFTDVHTYLYGSGSPITSDNSSASDAILQNISDGVGFVNYTAHCNWDGWSDPSFSVNDVPNLTNNGKYSLMIGNCCLSNKFDTPNNDGTCFGEAIMRAPNAGVIGYIGGSNYTYWDEDFYWGVGVDQIGITEANAENHTYANTGLGAYDASFHDHGESEDSWYVTSGQMLYAGNLSVTEGGSGFVHYYWEIYHLMGDPSVMAYFSEPTPMTVTHQSSQPVGISSFMVNTNAPGAYVAVSKDGVLLDAQLADANGDVMLNFTAIANLGMLDIVVTKQNRAPYIGTCEIIIGTEPPVSEFTADNTTIWEGETIHFTDLSTQAPNQWSWDFGDGTTSTEQHPSHTYASAGSYTVTLTTSNENGSSPTEVKTNYITVNELTIVPDADFTANSTEVNLGEDIQFTDASNNQTTSWYWDFGDGTSSTEQNPVHAYNSSGFFTVSLTATNAIGSDTETKTNYIEVLLEPYCDAASENTWWYENITNVTFGVINNDSGSDGYTDYTNMSTDVEQGGTYTLSVSYDMTYDSDEVLAWIDWNANHIFEDSEKYLVANGGGDEGPYTIDITVPLDAALGATRMRIRLHDTSSSQSNDTPCGNSSYGEVEDYTVNVISLGNAPTASFTVLSTEVCVGTEISFQDNSSNTETWSWSFGDQSVSSQQNPVHTYAESGTYTVTLTVSNSGGTDTETLQITVNPAPIAGFTFTQELSEISFTDNSTHSNSYSWDFGDGTSSTEQNPVHDFVNNGTYTVVQTVTGDCGTQAHTEEITVTGVGVFYLNQEPIEIYPNPASDVVTIKTDLVDFEYRLVSLDGRVVVSNKASGWTQLFINDVSAGVYQLIIESHQQKMIHKLVIQ